MEKRWVFKTDKSLFLPALLLNDFIDSIFIKIKVRFEGEWYQIKILYEITNYFNRIYKNGSCIHKKSTKNKYLNM